MTEQAVSTLGVALARAQGEMQNAAINKENPYFSSRYADLASIRDATVLALSKHGLCIYHVVMMQGEHWVVRGVLKHGETGESIISDFPLPNIFDKPQAVGSAITYGRRYTWAALCGIAAEEDDDANAAQGNVKHIERKSPPKPSAIEPPKPTALQGETPFMLARNAGMDWITWGKTFLDHVKQSKTTGDSAEWVKLNKANLEEMKVEAAKAHGRLCAAIFDHDSQITGALNASG